MIQHLEHSGYHIVGDLLAQVTNPVGQRACSRRRKGASSLSEQLLHVRTERGGYLPSQRCVSGALEGLTGIQMSQERLPLAHARRRPPTHALMVVPEARQTRICSHYIYQHTYMDRIRIEHVLTS